MAEDLGQQKTASRYTDIQMESKEAEKIPLTWMDTHGRGGDFKFNIPTTTTLLCTETRRQDSCGRLEEDCDLC